MEQDSFSGFVDVKVEVSEDGYSEMFDAGITDNITVESDIKEEEYKGDMNAVPNVSVPDRKINKNVVEVTANYKMSNAGVLDPDIKVKKEENDITYDKSSVSLLDLEITEEVDEGVMRDMLDVNNLDVDIQEEADKGGVFAEVKIFQCKKCFVVFDCQRLFQTHLCRRSITSFYTFHCKLCKKRFESELKLLSHTCDVIKGSHVYTCGICQKVFKKKHVLKMHMKIHSGYKPFVCEICSMAFLLKHQLVSHSSAHSDKRPFKCSVCAMAFKRSGALANHFIVHSGGKPRTCEICGLDLRSAYSLKRHVQQVHSGERPYACKDCPLTFKANYALTKHFKTVHGDLKKTKPCFTRRMIECRVCKLAFIWKKHLKAHMKRHYENGDIEDDPDKAEPEAVDLTCNVCFVTFTSEVRLFRHMTSQHKGSKRKDESNIAKSKQPEYACTHCKKKFFTRGGLVYHLKTHSVRKDFECIKCWSKFPTHKSFLCHTKTHTEKYTCAVCRSSYESAQSLSTHMENDHSDVKAFRCPFCKRSYALIATYIRHITKKTECRKGNVPSDTEAEPEEDGGLNRGGDSRNVSDVKESKRLSCLECNKTFTINRLYQKHIKTHKV